MLREMRKDTCFLSSHSCPWGPKENNRTPGQTRGDRQEETVISIDKMNIQRKTRVSSNIDLLSCEYSTRRRGLIEFARAFILEGCSFACLLSK